MSLNLQTLTKNWEALLPLSGANARKLVENARVAVAVADAHASGGAAAGAGEKAKRDEIWGHLEYHSDRIDDQPDSVYAGSWDLLDWSKKAWIQYNAVGQVDADLEFASDKILRDIGQNLVKLPGDALDLVGDAADRLASPLLKSLLSHPAFIVAIGGLALFYLGPMLGLFGRSRD